MTSKARKSCATMLKEHYRNLIKAILNDRRCSDKRAATFKNIWGNFQHDRTCLIKAPNTFYPAYATLWSAKQKLALVGCPFGFKINYRKLSAHGGLYKGLLKLMQHDMTHCRNNTFYPVRCRLYEKHVKLSEKSERYCFKCGPLLQYLFVSSLFE